MPRNVKLVCDLLLRPSGGFSDSPSFRWSWQWGVVIATKFTIQRLQDRHPKPLVADDAEFEYPLMAHYIVIMIESEDATQPARVVVQPRRCSPLLHVGSVGVDTVGLGQDGDAATGVQPKAQLQWKTKEQESAEAQVRGCYQWLRGGDSNSQQTD